MQAWHIEKLRSGQQEELKNFLYDQGLDYEHGVDQTLVAWHGDRIVGSCSSEGQVIKMFAVGKCYQGGGLSTVLLSHVLNRLFDQGYYTVLAYTPSRNRMIFESMQFRCLHDTKNVALMQIGINDLGRYLDNAVKALGHTTGRRGAIVMNGNPFTKGHAYLIEEAAKQCDELIVFVVEEDKSSFPALVRLEVIQEGVRHLKNVKVISGGKYAVSSLTFPEYFERSTEKKAQWSAELDAGLFCTAYAKDLHIQIRFVGTEPYCSLTRAYNKVLKRICGTHDIELVEIERFKVKGEAVSASQVRRLIRNQEWEHIKALVPEVTYTYITSEAARSIIDSIIHSGESSH